jgi:UDP-N-acetylmuramoylalanine--D-glutamate ligase
MYDYTEAKLRIFMNQGENETSVLNYDDPVLRENSAKLRTGVKFFSRGRRIRDGVYMEKDSILVMEDDAVVNEIPGDILRLKGAHNLENFMAAYLLARSVGIEHDIITKAAAEFQPIEHRLEFVRRLKGVDYYNDSKATNVDSTIKSIESFDKNLILLLGGKDKGGDFRALRDLLKKRVKLVILTGDASDNIRSQIGESVNHIEEKPFDDAVRAAINIAEEGDTVLLAPACASFDQFENFEERGRRFKEIVNSINGYGEGNG